MIIEFIGLPGSGKSYYCKELSSKIKPNYTRETILSKIVFYNYIKNIKNRNKILFLVFISLLLNISFNFKKTYALFLGVKDILKIYLSLPLFNNNIILDEGIYQRLLSLLFFKETKVNQYLFNKILNSLEQAMLPNILIYVDTYLEDSISQAKNRKAGLPFRYKNLNDNELKKVYKNQLKGLNQIEKRYQKHSFVKFVKLSNCNFNVDLLIKEVL